MGELQDSSAKRIDAYRKGYQSGTPDLLILNLHAQWNGFAIELKHPQGTGRLSEKQSDCLAQYRAAGFHTLVCEEYDRLVLEIVQYFSRVRLCCPHCRRRFKTRETLHVHLRHFHRSICH